MISTDNNKVQMLAMLLMEIVNSEELSDRSILGERTNQALSKADFVLGAVFGPKKACGGCGGCPTPCSAKKEV